MAVYFDHNASSPILDEALDAMLPVLRSSVGNASSLHSNGRLLRSQIESARQQVAGLVGCEPRCVIFTSGGSEANNLAIKGAFRHPRRIVASAIEHSSVLEPLKQMGANSSDTALLAVDSQGVVDLDQAEALLHSAPVDLLSIQFANNETGAIQPVAELARIGKACGAVIHCDASQGVGKIDLDMVSLGVDLMTISGHKFGAPQGTGALIARNHSSIEPLISGGPQEFGRRAGTENAALIVGLGAAAEQVKLNLNQRRSYLLELRGFFEQRLKSIAGVTIFSEDVERLPNTSYFSIPYYHGETLLMQLDQAGFELASGSACHSQVTEPSHVLKAMGIEESLALNAVRVSFGMTNTRQQIEQLVDAINGLVSSLPASMRQVAS